MPASFLGDANFPKSIQGVDQGGKILRYQDLFKKYSHLDLSEPADRPIAINSLQTRILTALGCKGDFGIFDEGFKGGNSNGLLRRSLLWCRDEGTTNKMSPITFQSGRGTSVPPSWSWMAYTGHIEYISPPFGGMKWEQLKSPWSGEVIGIYTERQGDSVVLLAKAREYDTGKGKAVLIFDSPGGSDQYPTRCVVLGRERGERAAPKEKRHYVLIVKNKHGGDRHGEQLCERVGAGWMLGKCIAEEEKPISIA